MIIKEYFGKQVHRIRKELKISQDELAKFMGYSRTSIVNIEAGRQSPPIEGLWKLCSALLCTPNDLLPPVEEAEFKEIDVDMVVVERVEKIVKVKKKVLVVPDACIKSNTTSET